MQHTIKELTPTIIFIAINDKNVNISSTQNKWFLFQFTIFNNLCMPMSGCIIIVFPFLHFCCVFFLKRNCFSQKKIPMLCSQALRLKSLIPHSHPLCSSNSCFVSNALKWFLLLLIGLILRRQAFKICENGRKIPPKKLYCHICLDKCVCLVCISGLIHIQGSYNYTGLVWM